MTILSCMNFLTTFIPQNPNISIALATLLPFLILILKSLTNSKRPVYLVDFACYKPKETQKVSTKYWINHLRTHIPTIEEETLQLTKKMVSRSGIGDISYASNGLLMHPPNTSLEEARKEVEEVVFGVVDGLLEKTGVAAAKVDILVVNCSLFNPAPSLCLMVVNRYGMRGDVKYLVHSIIWSYMCDTLIQVIMELLRGKEDLGRSEDEDEIIEDHEEELRKCKGGRVVGDRL